MRQLLAPLLRRLRRRASQLEHSGVPPADALPEAALEAAEGQGAEQSAALLEAAPQRQEESDMLLRRLVAYYGRALAKGKRVRKWWERGGDIVAVNVNTPLAYIPRTIEDGVVAVVALWAVAKEFGHAALACVYSWDGCLEDAAARIGGFFAARWTTWPLPPTGHVAVVTLDFREAVMPLDEFNYGVVKDSAYIAAALRGERSWCATVFINPSYVVHI